MQRWRYTLVLVVVALVGRPANAVVYTSADLRDPDPRSLERVKSVRGTFLAALNTAQPANSDRTRYRNHAARLEELARNGALSLEGRVDLGGCYLRLGQPHDTVRVLSGDDMTHFMGWCNLAVAYHELAVQEQRVNLLEEAIRMQRRALAAWPAVWSAGSVAAWSDVQWYFARRVERLHLRLLEQRFREQRLNNGAAPAWQTVDDLFGNPLPDASAYRPGRTSFAELDSEPVDAPWIVRELLFAYPLDNRLYWLYGELLNGRGAVEDALTVLNDLVDINQASNVRPLMMHRRILKERVDLLRELRANPIARDAKITPLLLKQLLDAVAPRGLECSPLGHLARESASVAGQLAIEELQFQERFGRTEAPTLPQNSLPVEGDRAIESMPTPPPVELPDWRPLLVGFGVGIVFASLAWLQVVEWRRRRELAQRFRESRSG